MGEDMIKNGKIMNAFEAQTVRELVDLAKIARDKGETFDAAGFIEKVLNAPPPPPPPPVTCPKCGSTQIQLVNRKWGLFTGILTNAVDRVCINCKHKF